MNTASASRGDPARKILVWDAPVRVFHWLMVASFAGAWLTAESERWRLLHVSLGYTLAGLVAFRIVWGLVGTRHARFSNFVRGPAAVARQLRSMLRGRPEHHIGHNPAAALAILGLLGLAVAVTATGWAGFNELGGEWLKEVHEAAASVMLAVVGVHIGGVLLSSWLERQNLALGMVNGRKTGRPDEAIRSAWRSVAVLMLATVLGFWWLQWQGAPTSGGKADRPVATKQVNDHDKHDD
ncbi:MAG: cytochrome b/b6 domain-containing protein [Rubrivivax sp.]